MTSTEYMIKILPAKEAKIYMDKYKSIDVSMRSDNRIAWITELSDFLFRSYENFGVEIMEWLKPHYSREKADETICRSLGCEIILSGEQDLLPYFRDRLVSYLVLHIQTAMKETDYKLDIEKKLDEYPLAPVVKKFINKHYYATARWNINKMELLAVQLQWMENNRTMIKASEVVPIGSQTKIFSPEIQKWYTEQFEEGKRRKIELIGKWEYYQRIIWVLSRSYRDFATELITWIRANHPDSEFEAKYEQSGNGHVYDEYHRGVVGKCIKEGRYDDTEVRNTLQRLDQQMIGYVELYAKHVFATRKPDFESFFSRYPMCPVLKSFDLDHGINGVLLVFQLEWMRTGGVVFPKEIAPSGETERMEQLVKNIIHNAANLMGELSKK